MAKRAALVLVLLAAAALLAAEEPSIYVKTLYVEKVYATTLGFKIEYRRPTSIFWGQSYLPLEWFGGDISSKAALVYSSDPAVPFLNIHFKDGEIERMVLYVHRSSSHISWGRLEVPEQGTQARGEFERRFAIDKPSFAY